MNEATRLWNQWCREYSDVIERLSWLENLPPKFHQPGHDQDVVRLRAEKVRLRAALLAVLGVEK